MIQIDGSYLEGGGQIVRTALALSTLTGKPFRITDIRKKRPKPGLKAQHLSCIEALRQLCNAQCDASLGDTEITYIPGKIRSGTINIDIGTAGSITLLLQSVLLPCCFAGKRIRLTIRGGTDVAWSMPVDYFRHVVLPFYQRFADIDFRVMERGFYPKGGGLVEIKIKPGSDIDSYSDFSEFRQALKGTAFDLEERGRLVKIKGISVASKDLLDSQVAERQARNAEQLLKRYEVPVSVQTQYAKSLSPGSVISLWAVFSRSEDDADPVQTHAVGSDCLGAPGKRSESVAKEAADKLIACIGSGDSLDEHSLDNIIPLMALCGGTASSFKISDHTKTNIYTAERFIDCRFSIDGNIVKVI
ncbi:RNA 3'-terminal phosphate cyclase [Candidatus Woesearchaeota archaeon]|nr:RNA 3'-terminal phosphate cyclase [Candidatus Woesearchaeota archaeon]